MTSTTSTLEAFRQVLAGIPVIRPGDRADGFDAVQDFLSRFGYLPADGGVHRGEADDATQRALTEYQQHMGLTPSGVFDEATRGSMQQSRCALPDLGSALSFSAACAWTRTSLTFAFGGSSGGLPTAGMGDAVRRAFATWAAACPVTFTESSSGSGADIDVSWRPASDPDHSMLGTVLAHADFPPGCDFVTTSLPKPLHFDAEEHTWTTSASPGSFDVETVALHEIGHLLGLMHSSVPGSVMFPTVSAGAVLRTLTADDRSGVAALYPGASTRLLRLGSKGPDVREWQSQLNQALGLSLAADGSFGPQTSKATQDFQRARGLSADGVVGPASRAAMRAALGI